MPPVLFYVIVEQDDEVFHERAFTHEMSAKEWASGFDDKFKVSMGRYALAPWPKKRTRTAKATARKGERT